MTAGFRVPASWRACTVQTGRHKPDVPEEPGRRTLVAHFEVVTDDDGNDITVAFAEHFQRWLAQGAPVRRERSPRP